jgi:hypothetical protein
MPVKSIDLDKLMRVVGQPPPRYRKGDPRNRSRAQWYKRANRALSAILSRTPRVHAKTPKDLATEAPSTNTQALPPLDGFHRRFAVALRARLRGAA